MIGGKIYVAGHRGMVGSALVRRLARERRVETLVAGREELDLLDQAATYRWLGERRPDAVIVAAARVGGIEANRTYPADFLLENVVIAANLIEGARRAGVGRLLYLGSSCIYPRLAPQPMSEGALLGGPLEPTNEAYAIAKIAGLKLCEYSRRQRGLLYHSAMPTNLYGPGDNYHPENAHVIPALLRRFHDAREAGADRVTIWGSGTPRREFLHVDDLAEACVFLLGLDDPPDLVNVGAGEDWTIRDLAGMIAGTVGYRGRIETDPTRPDGAPRKLMDVARMTALGWRARIPLREGLTDAYRDFRERLRDGTLRG